MRPAMSSARIVSPVYSMTWPLPPAVVILPMIASTMSLAEQPKPSVPDTSICMFFAGRCSSVWVAMHVLDLRRADAEGQRAQRAMGRGVAVAAHERGARQRQAKLRPDDVHDALPHIEDRDIRHPELDDVLLQRLHLDAAVLFLDVGRRCAQPTVGMLWSATAMVRSGRRSLRPARRRPSNACGRRDLVQEMAVDVEDAGAVRERLHDVTVPDLVEQRAWPAGGHIGSRRDCDWTR